MIPVEEVEKEITKAKKEIAKKYGENHFEVLFLSEIDVGDYDAALKLWNELGNEFINQLKD